jgi:hypothetical protein
MALGHVDMANIKASGGLIRVRATGGIHVTDYDPCPSGCGSNDPLTLIVSGISEYPCTEFNGSYTLYRNNPCVCEWIYDVSNKYIILYYQNEQTFRLTGKITYGSFNNIEINGWDDLSCIYGKPTGYATGLMSSTSQYPCTGLYFNWSVS